MITLQAVEGTALPLVAYGVPKKALAPTDSAEPEQAYVTEDREPQLLKARIPILVTEAGMVMEVRPVLRKAL